MPSILKAPAMLGLFLCLSGCSLFDKPKPAPGLDFAKPEVPKVTVADKAGDYDARSMGYAAAAVTVAKEKIEENKPKVAARELDVALANLVKPSIDQVQSARKRADAGKDETYTAHIRKAEELQKKSDEAWSAFEREKGKNDLLLKQIEAEQKRHEADLKAKERQNLRDNQARVCNIAAAVLGFAALVAGLLRSFVIAGICGASAAGLIALPLFIDRVLDMPHFDTAVLGTGGILLAAVLFAMFKKRKTANAFAETQTSPGQGA